MTQFRGICEMIPKIQHTDINDVDFKEFNKRCNDATKDIKLGV